MQKGMSALPPKADIGVGFDDRDSIVAKNEVFCRLGRFTLARRKMTEKTPDASNFGRDCNGRFLTGNSGGGRPKGSRNKLGEKFIEDAYAEWQKSGPAALKTMAETDPGRFVRVIAGILPAKLDVTVEHELFAAAATFAEAFRIARRYVGAEETIELKAIEHETNRD
ncbi:MAG: hypothetical protein WCA54_16850 [Pseudolabrys sp.]